MYRNRLMMEKQAYDHRLEMLKELNETQENERSRIAKDIHDQVGAIFLLAKINAGELIKHNHDESLNEKAKEIENLIIRGISEIRKSIQALTPTVLDKFGFIKSIEHLCTTINSSEKINSELFIDGEYIVLKPGIELAMYRTIQEIVNNALKHANASNIDIQIVQNPEVLTITVSDDGDGFDISQKDNSLGLGLKNIENRIFLIGGKTELSSSPGFGTVWYLDIPTENNRM